MYLHRSAHVDILLIARSCPTTEGVTIVDLTGDGVVRAGSTETGERLLTMDADATVRSVCYATFGRTRMFVTGNDVGEVRFWCLETGRFLREARGHADAIRSLVSVTNAAF